MSRTSISASFTFSWLSHDSWSESYVGTRRLTYDILPAPTAHTNAEESALCQLALIGANHLMEVALYKALLPHAKANSTNSRLTEALLDDASYYHMLTKWLPAASGKSVDLNSEPFVSTERLRRRRNDTIHKTSALATVEMARSALFSSVAGTREVFAIADQPFPYEPVLKKFSLPSEDLFSSVSFPRGA